MIDWKPTKLTISLPREIPTHPWAYQSVERGIHRTKQDKSR